MAGSQQSVNTAGQGKARQGRAGYQYSFSKEGCSSQPASLSRTGGAGEGMQAGRAARGGHAEGE